MWWLIFPIAAFILILCFVLQDHYNAQIDRIKRDKRESVNLIYFDDDDDESSYFECETCDEPIYQREKQ